MSPMVRRPPGIELALLGFLKEGPQHGYQIFQTLSNPEGLGPIWNLKQSQLYALLSKLEDDGYIWGVLQPQEAARPPRRVFHLTQAGQNAYQKWVRSPVATPREMRQEFMAKLFFAKQEGQEHTRELLRQQRATCRSWLDDMRAEAETPPADTFNFTLNQYRVGQIEATLKWLVNV
jgi:PadR family transcriptional regulator AphA